MLLQKLITKLGQLIMENMVWCNSCVTSYAHNTHKPPLQIWLIPLPLQFYSQRRWFAYVTLTCKRCMFTFELRVSIIIIMSFDDFRQFSKQTWPNNPMLSRGKYRILFSSKGKHIKSIRIRSTTLNYSARDVVVFSEPVWKIHKNGHGFALVINLNSVLVILWKEFRALILFLTSFEQRNLLLLRKQIILHIHIQKCMQDATARTL